MNKLILFAIPLLLSCGNLSSKQLPTKFNKLKIIWMKDGGMVYHSEKITISTDSCFYEIIDQGNKTRKAFKTPSKKLEAFYKDLREVNLSKIKTKEEMTYDRGGTSFVIIVDNKEFEFSNSGSTYITRGQEEYYKIEEMIFQFINKNKE